MLKSTSKVHLLASYSSICVYKGHIVALCATHYSLEAKTCINPLVLVQFIKERCYAAGTSFIFSMTVVLIFSSSEAKT